MRLVRSLLAAAVLGAVITGVASAPRPPAAPGGSSDATLASYDPSLPAPQYLDGVDGAAKIVEVVGQGWNSMYATMALWQRQANGSWALATNPFPVYVGEYGWAWPSQEHEGGPPTSIPATLRSPVGSYTFGTGFGWAADPGYGGPWLDVAPYGNPLSNPAYGGDTFWNESPGTSGYNTPSATPTYPWNENLTTTPQYDQAALIDYNTPGPGQVPGRGSGIFVHDDPPGYSYTAGCVGVPNGMIDTVLKFIDVSDTRIIMGPAPDISTPPPPPPAGCPSSTNQAVPAPVGITAVDVSDRRGYYIAGASGTVVAYGAATWYGDMTGYGLNAPIISITATADGKGYYLLAADGGVFSFGDARFYGSTGNMKLNAPVVGMAVTPDGGGYWVVAQDGGVFSFGDARFYGSTGNMKLNRPVDGISVGADGTGYRLVASDGGVFDFGSAAFYGSVAGLRLNAPVVGMSTTTDYMGYTLVGADGGVFNFGDSPFYGSLGGSPPPGVIVDLGPAPGNTGYYLLGACGGVFAFGPGAPFLGADD
jgi:L,D-peptidoglycan transpeptidase YkuD (ErfK/YbiS/YcfS/YnhG family)